MRKSHDLVMPLEIYYWWDFGGFKEAKLKQVGSNLQMLMNFKVPG